MRSEQRTGVLKSEWWAGKLEPFAAHQRLLSGLMKCSGRGIRGTSWSLKMARALESSRYIRIEIT